MVGAGRFAVLVGTVVLGVGLEEVPDASGEVALVAADLHAGPSFDCVGFDPEANTARSREAARECSYCGSPAALKCRLKHLRVRLIETDRTLRHASVGAGRTGRAEGGASGEAPQAEAGRSVTPQSARISSLSAPTAGGREISGACEREKRGAGVG